MKAYITKYALTSGIGTFEVDHIDGGMCVCLVEGGLNGKGFFHGKEWHLEKEKALERCEEMRIAKIKSLNNKIEELKKKHFIIG